MVSDEIQFQSSYARNTTRIILYFVSGFGFLCFGGIGLTFGILRSARIGIILGFYCTSVGICLFLVGTLYFKRAVNDYTGQRRLKDETDGEERRIEVPSTSTTPSRGNTSVHVYVDPSNKNSTSSKGEKMNNVTQSSYRPEEEFHEVPGPSGCSTIPDDPPPSYEESVSEK